MQSILIYKTLKQHRRYFMEKNILKFTICLISRTVFQPAGHVHIFSFAFFSLLCIELKIFPFSVGPYIEFFKTTENKYTLYLSKFILYFCVFINKKTVRPFVRYQLLRISLCSNRYSVIVLKNLFFLTYRLIYHSFEIKITFLDWIFTTQYLINLCSIGMKIPNCLRITIADVM